MMGTLHSGDHIGDWVIEATLGQGGMGSVYQCHSKLSSKVRAAVKVVEVLDEERDDARTRFVREIEVLEGLKHENIVRVRGGGEDVERSLLYLAMDLIEGNDLQRACIGTAVPWEDAAHLIRQISEGLAAAHQLGVHHRDIKPANIMLQADGLPVLIDFGIAIQQGQNRLTRRNGVLGTLAYVPPEIFSGKGSDPVKADIYALGVVFWELVTGQVAFPDSSEMTPEERQGSLVSQKIRARPMDPGEDFPDAVRILLSHCTHPDPSRRLDSAESLAASLRQLVGTEPSSTALGVHALGPAPDTSRDTFTLDPDLPTEVTQVPEVPASFPWVSIMGSTILTVLPNFLLIVGLALYQGGVTTPGLVLTGLYILTCPFALPIGGATGLVLTGMGLRQLRSREHTHPGWYAVSVLLAGTHIFQFAIGVVICVMVLAAALGVFPEVDQAERSFRDFYDNSAPTLQADRVNPSTTIAGASTCPIRSVSEHN